MLASALYFRRALREEVEHRRVVKEIVDFLEKVLALRWARSATAPFRLGQETFGDQEREGV